ncbi:MAG: flagellar protein FlaG [Leptolinea sp.]|nr:flagellar protein FlaG [Leptolinea sp.]
MSDYSVNPISGSSNEVPVGHPHNSESSVAHKKPAQEVKSPVPMYTFPGNTKLVYKVDEASHEVVVFIVDEASSEIIRTVPGDAMNDLPSGGLVQKSA